MDEALKYMIVVAGGLMSYAEIRQAIRLSKIKADYAWVKWGLGIMGAYWSLYYMFSIIRDIFGISIYNHQVLVRSPLLVTISLVAAGAIMSLRRTK